MVFFLKNFDSPLLFNLTRSKHKLFISLIDFNISMTKLKRHESIQEGDSVNLTCTDRCDVGNFSSVFIWFKNGEHLQDGRVLQLRNVSFTNSGNYTCSVKTGTGTTSGVLHVDVEREYCIAMF